MFLNIFFTLNYWIGRLKVKAGFSFSWFNFIFCKSVAPCLQCCLWVLLSLYHLLIHVTQATQSVPLPQNLTVSSVQFSLCCLLFCYSLFFIRTVLFILWLFCQMKNESFLLVKTFKFSLSPVLPFFLFDIQLNILNDTSIKPKEFSDSTGEHPETGCPGQEWYL